MNIFVLGINHKTAPIALREKFSMPRGAEMDHSEFFHNIPSIREMVILSTCNRTEIYGRAETFADARAEITEALSRFSKLPQAGYERHLYAKEGAEAAGHLFAVAAGLDSLVLGETEILGQVKTAYHDALEEKLTGKAMNMLFQKALNVAKKVRTHTDIGSGKVSIASVAVDLSLKIYYKLDDKKVLLIGAGGVARQVCESLRSHGVTELIFANRSQEHAEGLAEEFGGAVVPFEDIDLKAPAADIVITSTGSPKAFIHKERAEHWIRERKRKGIFIIDLGMPRNVEEEVNELSDVYLYNVDDLKSAAESNVQGRERAAELAGHIVEESAQAFMRNFNGERCRITERRQI